MDEKQFEQEYRNWKRQAAPDLWDRIEGGLKSYPEREELKQPLDRHRRRLMDRAGRYSLPAGLAAGFAAVLCFAVVVPGLFQGWFDLNRSGAGMQESIYSADFQETMAAETKGALEENKEVLTENKEAQQKSSVSGGAAQTENGALEGFRQREGSAAGAVMKAGYRLTVPEDAFTAEEDSAYFSQAILRDTELLCTGTVEEVSLDYDAQGRAVGVVYQLSLTQVHYAQDYVAETSQITVKSPIVKAEGDEAWILYQMKPGTSYLLPLKNQEGNWELLYPFAPQIELTDSRGYLFHSGYSRLVNEETQVVAGRQEGENDYFYDRMLLREDEGFLSDVLELIQKP